MKDNKTIWQQFKPIWQQFKRLFILAHYGQEHPFCQHTDVKIRSFECVTMRPKSGVCRTCGKLVNAKTVWIADSYQPDEKK